MNKGLIIFISILVLGGGMTAYWLFYEKPIKDEMSQIVDLNIYSVDEMNRHVATNFTILIDKQLFYSGKTLRNGAVEVSIPYNTDIIIKTQNRPDQNFYTGYYVGTPKDNDTRIKLNLVQPTELNIELVNGVEKEGNLTFNLSTENEFRNIIVCLDWTTNFVYVKSGYELLDKPIKRYSDYEKCYKTGVSVGSDKEEQVIIDYKVWGSLEEKDYLKIVFIDSDWQMHSNNEEDIFANDLIYEYNINNI